MVPPSLVLLAALQIALRMAFLAANRRARRAGWSEKAGAETNRRRLTLRADAYLQSHPKGPGFFYDYALAANLVLATAAASSAQKKDESHSPPTRRLRLLRWLRWLLGSAGGAAACDAPSADLVAAVAELEPGEEGAHYPYAKDPNPSPSPSPSPNPNPNPNPP